LLSELKKPDLLDEKAFAFEKKAYGNLFHATAGIAAIAMKDYSAAAESFRAVMTLNAGPLLTDHDRRVFRRSCRCNRKSRVTDSRSSRS